MQKFPPTAFIYEATFMVRRPVNTPGPDTDI